jgi:outer membrane protein TolC
MLAEAEQVIAGRNEAPNTTARKRVPETLMLYFLHSQFVRRVIGGKAPYTCVGEEVPIVTILLVLLIASAVVSVAQEYKPSGHTTPAVLTIEDAINTALSSNNRLKIDTFDVTKAREGIAEARTGFLPQMHAYVLAGYELDRVTFTVPVGVFGVYPATGPIPGKPVVTTPAQFAAYIYGYVGQPVTQLYKASLAVREAHLGVDLAQENLRGRQQEVRRQVKETYAALAQMQAAIENAGTVVNYLSQLAELTDRNLKEELVLRSDALAIHARLKAQRFQLLTLQDRFTIKKEAFNQLLGRDVRTEFAIVPQPAANSLEMDLDAARRVALENRFEIRQARLQTAMAEMDIRREKAEYIPNLSVQLSYWSFQDIAFLPQNVASAGFAFDWEVFDFGYKKHRLNELKATRSQKQLGQQEAEQTVIVDVDTNFQKVKEARALLDVETDLLGAEQQKLQELTHLYEQHSIVVTDVLQQQSAVSQANSQYQEALATFWTARASFEQALGEE